MLSRNIQFISRDTLDGHERDEKRRGGRFSLVGVTSNLGSVLDLSHCGAMIAKKRWCRRPLMATFPVEIRNDKSRIYITARLARTMRVKGVGLVMGLEFIDVTDKQREQIKQLVTYSRHWNVLPDELDAA